MSIPEASSSDMKVAWSIMHKLTETFTNFESHYFSIITLSEQWRNLQTSFAMVHTSLENRAKELEVKETELELLSNSYHCFRIEVELRQKKLECEEEALRERVEGMEKREKQVMNWCEAIDLRKKEIFERLKDVEVREEMFAEGLERVKTVDEEEERVEEREMAVEERERVVSEHEEAVEERERVVRECEEAVDEREIVVSEREEAVEERERVVSKREEAVSVREKDIVERIELLEVNEVFVKERLEGMEVKEKEIDTRWSEVEAKEKDVSEVYSAEQKRLSEKRKVLGLKEKQLNEQRQVVKLKEKQIEESSVMSKLKEKELDDRYQMMEMKEKEIDTRWSELERKEKDVSEQCEAVEVKEKRLSEQKEVLELKEKQVNEECELLKLKEKKVEESRIRLEFKEKQADGSVLMLNSKEKEFGGQYQQLMLREMQVNERCQAMQLKEQQMEMKEWQLNEGYRVLALKTDQFSQRWSQMELRDKVLENRFQSLETKEKQIKKLSKAMASSESQSKKLGNGLKIKDKQTNVHSQTVELEKQLNEPSQVEELKEKPINESCQVQGLKEEQINEPCLVEELKDNQSDEHCILSHGEAIELGEKQMKSTDAMLVSQELPHSDVSQVACAIDSSSSTIGGDICSLCRNMNVDGVRSHLINCVMDQKILQETILDALKSAPDPAKLVLGVSQGFFQKCRNKAETIANKTSCTICLEQMVKLSPPITSDVKDEARTFAAFWKAKLNGGNTPRDNFGFLQLLAAFKLANLYDADELLSYLNLLYSGHEVYEPEKSVYLCHELGLFEKIPGHINFLIKKKWLMAVKYTCVFNLECNFSPVALLEAQLDLVKKKVSDILMNGSSASKIQAARLKSENLRNVIRCIASLKLESKFPPDFLLCRMKQLETEKELSELCQVVEWKEKENNEPCLVELKKKQSEGHCILSHYQSQELTEKQMVSNGATQDIQELPHCDTTQVACAADSSSLKTGGEIHSLCRNMDVNGLRSHIIECVKEEKILHEKILDALRSAPDPAKLALDVSQSFHEKFKNKAETIANKTSIIYLLEQLMKLLPPITSDVKDEAKTFADFWKARLNGGETPIDNFGFLQLLAAFKLARSYDADELLSFFGVFYSGPEVYQPEENSYLCHSLGLAEKIFGLVESLIKRKEWLLAVKYVCVFKLEGNFPPVPLLEAHLELVKKNVNETRKDETLTTKIQAVCMELGFLQDVIKSVASLKLDWKLPLDSIVSRMKELEEENELNALLFMKLKDKQIKEPCLVEELKDNQNDGPFVFSPCETPGLRQEHIVSDSFLQENLELPHSDGPRVARALSSSSEIGDEIYSLFRNMNVDGVRLYLNEHVNKQKIFHEKILDALRSAPDPGKLVLGVSQSFHKVNRRKKAKLATKTSCIFLLDLMKKLSPPITNDLKDEARTISFQWRARLNRINTPIDVFGFLQLLTAFKLASHYPADELLSLFKIFYNGPEVLWPEENTSLCSALGLSEKIPGLIEFLIRTKQWLSAVKYICVFQLECNFPLVPLLEAHLDSIKKRVNESQMDGTFKSKIETACMELESLQDVTKCISSLKLESKFSLDFIVSRMNELEKEKERSECCQFIELKGKQINELCPVEELEENCTDERSVLSHVQAFEITKKPIGKQINELCQGEELKEKQK